MWVCVCFGGGGGGGGAEGRGMISKVLIVSDPRNDGKE